MSINPPLFADAAYWEAAWQEAQRASLYARRLPGRDGVAMWDKRAAEFAGHSQSGEGQRRIADVLHLISHSGALNPDAEVLDIGCGPGHYALALARRVKRVVALDPSPAMMANLQDRLAAEGIGNVETAQFGWEEADLDALGWRGRFDLVLALMTPGVHDAASLKKAVAAGMGGFVLGGHLRQDETAKLDLWPQVVGEPMPPIPADALYAFHLLYAWGYTPSLTMERRVSQREMPPEQATNYLEDHFRLYADLTPARRGMIAAYVAARAGNGAFTLERDFVSAYVTWRA